MIDWTLAAALRVSVPYLLSKKDYDETA